MERIEIHLSKIKIDAIYENTKAANNTKIKILRIILLDLTPVQISNNRHGPQQIYKIHFYISQCTHGILATPFFKIYIETKKVNRNKLTIKCKYNSR